VYDLAQTNPRLLEQQYGVIGLQLFFHAHGIDESILSNKYNPKSNSFSKNQILDRDYTSQEEIETVIKEMVEENATRLRSHQATTSVIHLSIGYSKHAWKSGFSHQLSIPATQSTKTLQKEFILLFKKHYDREPVRTINVTFGKIKQSNHKQLSLFDSYEKTRKEEQLENIIDYLRRKYGYTSILHASSLLKGSTVKKRAKLLGGHKA
jgi:DNA polymerase V